MRYYKFTILFLALLPLVSIPPGYCSQRGMKSLTEVKTHDGEIIKLYANSYALLIGINKYDDAKWRDLFYPVSDILEINERLEEQGFETTLLSDETKDKPTLENIEKYLKKMHKRAGQKDRLLIFYAGHGDSRIPMHSKTPKGFIIPRDAVFEDYFTYIPMDNIANMADVSDALHIMYLFDCCFSGLFVETRGPRKRPPPYITKSIENYTRLAVSAGDFDELASDESLFVKYFISAFEDWDSDFNKDGYLTSEELAIYISQNVSKESNETQNPRWGKMLKYSKGDIIFDLIGRKYGKIILTTNSSEVLSIYIDGEINPYKLIVGDSFSCELTVREHTIELVGKRHTEERKIYIKQDSTLKLFIEWPEERMGKISITSNIADESDIFLDDTLQKGKVSLGKPVVIRVGAGKHWVKVVGAEKTDTCTVNVITNQVVKFEADLRPEPPPPDKGMIIVTSDIPDKSKIYLDDKLQKKKVKLGKPVYLEVEAGEHFVKVVGPERTITRTIIVVLGQEVLVEIRFITLPGRFPDLDFVHIPGGIFVMGAASDEKGSQNDELPQHEVTISPFYMLTTEVTQALWDSVMDYNPSKFKSDDRPVETVSWNDCQTFLRQLNEKDTGKGYRLPTEAEWEYACRAGSSTTFNTGDELKKEYANFNYAALFAGVGGSDELKTMPIRSYSPNRWGLFDMHGNVWEWCQDWYGDYPDYPVKDPKGASKDSYKVHRGGSYISIAGACRSANRNRESPHKRKSKIGFRIVKANP